MDSLKKDALKKALIINRKKLKILTSLTTLAIISGINLFHETDKMEEKYISKLIMESEQKSAAESNDEFLTKYQEENILIANFDTTIPKKYKTENDKIIDSNGKELSLTNNEIDTYFFDYKLSEDILKKIGLKESKCESIGFNGSAVGNYVLDYLPSSLRYLSLRNCSFITDLNKLPDICPNIEVLDLNLMSGLTDLNFIYKMPNLKRVEISESAYITIDLLNYLYEKNIKTNLDIEDIINTIRIDHIINEIIKPEMNDEEKIKAITLYVINNMNYNINHSHESNKNPLSYSLNEKNGVCAGYAYLTNILLRKAGINSYKIINNDHAWNMIKLDNKYYYLDPTNIKKQDIYQFILDKTGIAKNYMIDTESTFNTSMTKPNSDKTIIPLDLITDIANGRKDKDLIEKYGANVINDLYYIASILAGIITFLGIIPMIGSVTIGLDTYYSIKEDYYDEIEKIFINNLE